EAAGSGALGALRAATVGTPPTKRAVAPPGPSATTVTPAPCEPMVSEGVRRASAGDLEAARAVLLLATSTCPDRAAPWREIAGLYALGGDWPQAIAAARRATDRERDDEHAWRILATGLFLEGDKTGALSAWNRLGEPRIDLLSVKGLERTRHAVVADIVGLPAETV